LAISNLVADYVSAEEAFSIETTAVTAGVPLEDAKAALLKLTGGQDEPAEEMLLALAAVEFTLATEEAAGVEARAEGLESVARLLGQLIAMRPSNAKYRYYLGLVAIEASGDAVTAIQHFERSRSLGFSSRPFVREFTKALFAERRFKTAIELLTDWSQQDPTDSKALLHLAVANLMLGDAKSASEAARRSLAQEESVDARLLLATAYEQQGRLRDAKQALASGLKMNPASTKLQSELERLESTGSTE
jgi:predicted Zn-dependent protease